MNTAVAHYRQKFTRMIFNGSFDVVFAVTAVLGGAVGGTIVYLLVG